MASRHQESRTGFRATFAPLLDDRGRPVSGIRRKEIAKAAESDHPGLRALAVRLKHAMHSESRRITPDRVVIAVAAIFAIFFFTGLVVSLILPLLRIPVPGVGLLVFVGAVIFANTLMTRYVRRGAAHQLARTAVAEGVCGACAFPLEGVPLDADGCLVCPECGGAWMAERVVEPFWDQAPVNRLRDSFLCAIVPGVLPRKALYAPDDRGRFVQTPDSRLMRVDPAVLAKIPPEDARRMRRSMRMVGVIPRWVLAAVLATLPAALMYGAWTARRDGSPGGAIFLGSVGAVFALIIATVPFSAAFSTPNRTSRRILRFGRCACCLGSLDQAPIDARGRSICGTCGSAWALPEARPTPGPTDRD